MRLIGGAVARGLLGREQVPDWLNEPRGAIARAHIPVLSSLVRAGLRRDSSLRLELLMSRGQPTVSIVMAAHNAADTIADAIDSVLRQTYPALELIVVDDASTDDTVKIVTALAEQDRRLRVVRADQQHGAAGARNHGLRDARGNYIAFHDADDVAHPERIERQLAALVRSPATTVCLCNFRRVDVSGNPVAVNGRTDRKCIISMMFARQVLERVGYFMRLPLSEDAEYYERIKLVYGPSSELRLFKTLYFARFLPTSLTFSDGDTNVGDGGNVSHKRSDDAERVLAQIRRIHDGIRDDGASPFVPYDQD